MTPLFFHRSAMTEETYLLVLWDRTLRCGTMFSDRRLKFLFIDGQRPKKLAQTRPFDSRSDYHQILQQNRPEPLGGSAWVAKGPAATTHAI